MRKDDPVSSRVFGLARTAGHPSEMAAGVLGVCLPVGSVCGAFVVKLFAGSLFVMFLAPCAIGGFSVLFFAVILNDLRLAKRISRNGRCGNSPAPPTSTKADVPQQIFLDTLAQAAVLGAASLIGGKLSDRTGRRKIFVLTASVVYGLALFVIALASHFSGFLVGMAISGRGGGSYSVLYMAAGGCAIIGAFAILPVRRVR